MTFSSFGANVSVVSVKVFSKLNAWAATTNQVVGLGIKLGQDSQSSAQIHQLGRATNNKSLTYLNTDDQPKR